MPFAKITSEGQSWELIRLREYASCLIGGGFKKLPKRHFTGIPFKNGTDFNKLLYHWTANYWWTTDKHVIYCPYTFSSIWPSCFCKLNHTGDSCNDVDRLEQWCRSLRTYGKRVPKFNRNSWRFFAYLDISLSINLLADLPRVCVQGFEKISACARAPRKKHFCTRMRVPAHAHMKTGFDNAKR